MRGLQRPVGAGLCVVIVAVLGALAVRAQKPIAEWHYYGGDKAFTRYSPLAQITRDNVKNLKIAWRRPAVDSSLTQAFPDLRVSAFLKATPIVIDGVLYTPNAHGLITGLRRRDRSYQMGAGTVCADGRRGRRPGHSRRRHLGARQRHANRRGARRIPLRARRADRASSFGISATAGVSTSTGMSWYAARFNDTSGPIVVGDVAIIAGQGGGGGDTLTMRKRRPKMSGATTSERASCAGRSRWYPERASSGTRAGATSRGSLQEIWRPVSAQRGRRARICIHSADGADRLLLRRLPTRRQPLCRHASWRSMQKPVSASGTSRAIHHDLWEYD